MGAFIGYIIIIAAIVRLVKRNTKSTSNSGGRPYPNRPVQPNRPMQQSQQGRPVQSQQSRPAQPNRPMQQSQQGRPAQPSHPAQQVQPSRPAQSRSSQSGNNILERAAANVRAYEDDKIEQGDNKQLVTAGHIDNCILEPDNCSLMEQVEDLMVMGYQAKLPFERDFIAEGMELLGQYEL